MPRRRTRLALTRSLRGLMALLWLAASLAYLTRDQTMLMQTMGMGSGGAPMNTAQMNTAPMNLMPGSAPSSSAPVSLLSAADAHTTHQMEMPAGPHVAADLDATLHSGSTSVQLPHLQQTHRANAPPAPPAPNHHAGHCPFCFTAAFALVAAAVDLLPAPPKLVPAVTALPVAAPRLSAADHDARAPPVLA